MKAVMHNGREGSGKHNDRTFLQGKSEQDRQEMAPHIDPDMTAKNRTWRIGHKDKGWLSGAGGDIEAAERAYYKKAYSAAQDAKNARYRAQRHPERCKTTDDLYTGKLTRPEEQILQIGSKDEQVDPEVFRACVQDYINELNAWNRAHGKHMQILSVSVHFDETTPHAHIRRVWEHDSKDGRTLGQDKALEAAGVPLPDPGKDKGRHNNRKMVFDAAMREKWLDICEAHGLQIDREPVPDMRHKDKADYIRDRIAGELAQAQEQVDRETARAETVRNERIAAEASGHQRDGGAHHDGIVRYEPARDQGEAVLEIQAPAGDPDIVAYGGLRLVDHVQDFQPRGFQFALRPQGGFLPDGILGEEELDERGGLQRDGGHEDQHQAGPSGPADEAVVFLYFLFHRMDLRAARNSGFGMPASRSMIRVLSPA